MKNNLILLTISILMVSCGFQQRKYTHGYWVGSSVSDKYNGSNGQDAMSNHQQVNNETEAELSASFEDHVNLSEVPVSSCQKWNESSADTIVPKNAKSAEEDDFVAPKNKKNEYATEHDPCYDPNRDVLSKEVADNVLWGIISMIGTALYFIGFIPATIYFFKSIKTHKKIKALNGDGRYNDLKKMNFAALLANGAVFSILALTLLVLIFVVILALTGNF